MRSPDKRLIVGLSVSTAIAVAAFAAVDHRIAGAAHAQLLDGLARRLDRRARAAAR